MKNNTGFLRLIMSLLMFVGMTVTAQAQMERQRGPRVVSPQAQPFRSKRCN